MELEYITYYKPMANNKEDKGYILDLKNDSRNNIGTRNDPEKAIMYFIEQFKVCKAKARIDLFCSSDVKTVFTVIPSSNASKKTNSNHIKIGNAILDVPYKEVFRLKSDLTKQTNQNTDRRARLNEVNSRVDVVGDLSDIERIILLDDVVTTKSTFKAFENKIHGTYPRIEIFCLALAKTSREE